MQESKEKWINKKMRTVAAYRSTESWAAALALKLAASFMAKNTLISTRDTCGFRMLVCNYTRKFGYSLFGLHADSHRIVRLREHRMIMLLEEGCTI